MRLDTPTYISKYHVPYKGPLNKKKSSSEHGSSAQPQKRAAPGTRVPRTSRADQVFCRSNPFDWILQVRPMHRRQWHTLFVLFAQAEGKMRELKAAKDAEVGRRRFVRSLDSGGSWGLYGPPKNCVGPHIDC